MGASQACICARIPPIPEPATLPAGMRAQRPIRLHAFTGDFRRRWEDNSLPIAWQPAPPLQGGQSGSGSGPCPDPAHHLAPCEA